MNEKINEEIASAARLLEMDINEVRAKYESICEDNSLTEDDWRLGLSLFRQWFSGAKAYAQAPQREASSNSLIKEAHGFFVSLDAARDMAAMQNERIKNEYMMDSDTSYSMGKVAVANSTQAGYEVSRMYNGEEQVKEVTTLPDNNFEVDMGTWIIPLDSIAKYGERKNPNHGKPLPAQQFRMSGVFIGSVDGDEGLYFFSYKGEACKDFNPKTFTMVDMEVIRDQNNTNRIYGFKTGTLQSLVVSEHQKSADEYKDLITAYAGENLSSLVDLDRYHSNLGSKNYAEKFVITDGSVSSVNMTPNSYGTRRVTVTDLNADFDYDGGSWAGTTCWFPSSIEIEFGLGSNVIVVGRTSLGKNEDGSPGDVSLNVSGVLVVENRGVVTEPFDAGVEEDLDWF